MISHAVLVRAWRGKPVHMVAVAHAPGIIYASRPEALPKVQAGQSQAVGFPIEDVFRPDPHVFEILRARWEAAGVLERSDWRKAGASNFNLQ